MDASKSALSPWTMVLGERFAELHPRLKAYFQAIPEGSIGTGEGMFDTVGTPRGWLRFLIGLIVDRDVLFAVWEHNVPFTVTNRAAESTGRSAVAAERTLRLSGGDRVMRDLIMASPLGIVDVLGVRRRIRALFIAEVVDGGVHLTSTRVALRVGRRHLIFPQVFSPIVSLTEHFSDEDERQHVSLVMHVPLVGRVYEYAGSFRYDIKSGGS